MERIEHLSPLNEFMRDYNGFSIYWKKEEFGNENIPIYIKTLDELLIKILCSKDLSVAIKNGNRELEEINNNIVIRVTKPNGSTYLRVSNLTKGMLL